MPESRRPYGSLRKGGAQDAGLVKILQRDLRTLGYLAKGIDGDFGLATESAVRGLRFDLLNNDGTGSDGAAPVSVRSYNRGRVSNVAGSVDAGLANCIADMLEDDAFPKLPASTDPRAENARAVAFVERMESPEAPIPFLLAILRQESDLKHYAVPRGNNEDNFVTVGLDRNRDEPHIITSRGYGVGQFTLFHHPPQRAEVEAFISDVPGNVAKAVDELNEKFRHFVNGNTSGTQADDRIAEAGRGPLRTCKFAEDDPRRFRDCAQCLRDAGRADVVMGETPWYAGSSSVYQTAQYHESARYNEVPVRANVGCDWPYAVRRYNGSGQNSYHYQCQVLLRVLNGGS